MLEVMCFDGVPGFYMGGVVVQRLSAIALQQTVLVWRLRVPAVFIWFPVRALVSSHNPKTGGCRSIFKTLNSQRCLQFLCSLGDGLEL